MNDQDIQDDPAALNEKAARAFLWDMAGTFARQGVAFLLTLFLARLLMPAEFGMVAMAMVFVTIFQTIADFGLASALIQNKNATSLIYSTVFFFNMVAGIFLFGIFWLAAPLIGVFFEIGELTPIVRWLSLGFIINAFNQVQQSILRRNIDFKKIAVRSAAAQLVSGVIAIVLAIRGMGVYALVAQNLLGLVFGAFLLWHVSEWRPRWEFSWKEMKSLSGFSVYVFLNHVTGKLTAQLDTLIVGKIFNAATLGFYNRAASLNSIVTSFSSASISKIAFSLLSRLQDEKERFIKTYLVLLELVAFLSFGLSGALILAGSDLIGLLFGKNWADSVLIFQILAMKSFTYPVSLLIVSVFWAGGKSKDSFWYGNIGRIVALLPLVPAMVWGFQPFLYAVVIAAILNWILTNWFVSISFNISFLIQCRVIGLYLALFLGVGIPLYAVLQAGYFAFPYHGAFLGITFAAIYVGLNWLLRTQGYSFCMEHFVPMITRWSKKA